jgi:hypothetical protein
MVVSKGVTIKAITTTTVDKSLTCSINQAQRPRLILLNLMHSLTNNKNEMSKIVTIPGMSMTTLHI